MQGYPQQQQRATQPQYIPQQQPQQFMQQPQQYRPQQPQQQYQQPQPQQYQQRPQQQFQQQPQQQFQQQPQQYQLQKPQQQFQQQPQQQQQNFQPQQQQPVNQQLNGQNFQQVPQPQPQVLQHHQQQTQNLTQQQQQQMQIQQQILDQQMEKLKFSSQQAVKLKFEENSKEYQQQNHSEFSKNEQNFVQKDGIHHHISTTHQKNVETLEPKGPSSEEIQTQFLKYYNQDIYQQINLQEQDPIYGQFDLYELKPEIIQQQKPKGQLYPKWLPKQLAIKQFVLDQTYSEQLQQQVKTNIDKFFMFNPQFIKVLATQTFETDNQEEQELRIFYHYFDQSQSLDQDIIKRREENCKYHEKLVWNVFYNLLKGSVSLKNVEQSINDINTQNLFLHHYQIQFLPFGIVPEISSEKEPQQFSDELQQIGHVMIQMLLLQNSEIYDYSNLENNINQIKNNIDKSDSYNYLIVFTLEFLIFNQNSSIQDPQQMYSLIQSLEKEILFMDFKQLRLKMAGLFTSKFQEYKHFQHQFYTQK